MRAMHSWIAALGLAAAATAGQAAPLFAQGFDDVAGLAAAGWTFQNVSAAPGVSWFQGNPGVFEAQAGAPDSYLAANFAASDAGAILTIAVTPAIALSGGEVLSFYTRTEFVGDVAFDDNLAVVLGRRIGAGVVFDTQLVAVGPTLTGSAYPTDWRLFTATVPRQPGLGPLYIGFAYTSADAGNANYIGVDSVTVNVPEPAAALLLVLGLAGIGAARRVAARWLPAAVLALAGAAPAGAAEGDDLRAVKDPVTGQLRAPTREEAQALQAQDAKPPAAAALRARAAAAQVPAVETRPNGSRKLVLGEAAMTYSVVTRRPDGTLGGLQCVTGEKAAEATVSGPRFGAAVLTREAAHEAR